MLEGMFYLVDIFIKGLPETKGIIRNRDYLIKETFFVTI